ncbi:MAG: hypothetical protein ACJA08_001112 [Cyclobacteriaceae bacterium]|jgi:hypothetical protein
MYRNFLFLIISSFLIFACNDDDVFENICSEDNPTTDLDWLASEIQTLEQSELSQFFYVSQAEYENMTVFIFGNCCPNCNTVIPVRNCSGELVGIIGNGDDDIEVSILTKDTIIWKPNNFECVE